MIYIYDIILNLNDNLIEYFEWEEQDNIKYIKKIPFYKISNKLMQDLINKKIKITKDFLDKILNKAYLEANYEYYKYLVLFTDGKIILGVNFTDMGVNNLISRLLIDEEEEILMLGNRLDTIDIKYKVLGDKKISNCNLTREEQKVKKELEKEFSNLYNNNKIDKLNYWYYEYFNEINNNKVDVYQKLISSINDDFNVNHIKLYEIIKMSYNK